VQQQEIKRRWETRISDSREMELAELRRTYSATGKLGGLIERAGAIGSALGKLRGLVKRK